MTVLCMYVWFSYGENNSNRSQHRVDPNCNDLIRHSHLAQYEDRHPEDIKRTNYDEWKANSEGGIAVTLRKERSYLLRGFAHKRCQMIAIHYISGFSLCISGMFAVLVVY